MNSNNVLQAGFFIVVLLAAAVPMARYLSNVMDGSSRVVANVGTGREISVLELARTVVELCGKRSAIEHAPARSGEILKSLARVDRLRDKFGIAAETPLVDGLRNTLA